jgi:hypothetical protein
MTEAQIFDVEKAQKLLKGKLSNIEDAKEKNCIFAGTSNPELAKSIADLLGLPLSGLTVANFADGEVSIKVNDSVRQKEVYIIQPVCRVGDKSVNDNLMQLLLLISTFRRASASKICAVIPYYGLVFGLRPDLGNFAAWPKALGSSPLHPLGRVEVPNRL